MKLRVLGCYGAEFLGYKSVAFLINDFLLIDAGNISSLEGVGEFSKIRHVAISHVHLDHIKALPFIAEQLMEEVDKGLEVFGTEESIGSLRRYIFNGSIWPDFSVLPTPQHPAIHYTVIREGSPVYTNGLTINAIPVDHTIPAVGFLIGDGRSSVLYSGDTGPTHKIWDAANNTQDLKALLIEVSYPNRLRERAMITKHLTPQLMVEELKKVDIKKGVLILAYHLKPPYVDEIRKEICEMKIDNLILLEDGDIFEI